MPHSCLNAAAIVRILMLSGLGSLIGLGEISRAQTPAAIDPAPQTASSAPKITIPSSGDAFIDRTDYSLGATERIESEKAIVKPVAPQAKRYTATDSVSIAPVEVGGVNLSVSGISWSAPAPSNPIGSTYGTVQNYYNRTVRPIGRIGNSDIKLIFPLSIPAPITSMFGWRLHPITGDARLHTGTDIGAPLGTPVLAALTGRVIMADFFGGYGLAVALEHNAGAQQTLYAHLSEIFVKPGDIVKQGSVLGRVGSTGNSTGPHLHFEVRQQTTEGWVAMDAGVVLETAMADLVKSMQVAQAPKPR